MTAMYFSSIFSFGGMFIKHVLTSVTVDLIVNHKTLNTKIKQKESDTAVTI